MLNMSNLPIKLKVLFGAYIGYNILKVFKPGYVLMVDTVCIIASLTVPFTFTFTS